VGSPPGKKPRARAPIGHQTQFQNQEPRRPLLFALLSGIDESRPDPSIARPLGEPPGMSFRPYWILFNAPRHRGFPRVLADFGCSGLKVQPKGGAQGPRRKPSRRSSKTRCFEGREPRGRGGFGAVAADSPLVVVVLGLGARCTSLAACSGRQASSGRRPGFNEGASVGARGRRSSQTQSPGAYGQHGSRCRGRVDVPKGTDGAGGQVTANVFQFHGAEQRPRRWPDPPKRSRIKRPEYWPAEVGSPWGPATNASSARPAV